MAKPLFQTEHANLIATAGKLTTEMRNCERRLEPTGTQFSQHNQFAQRVLELSLHLDGAVKLAELDLYPSAFALLRTALEHYIFDRLLFLADQFRQRYSGVTGTQWNEYQQAKRDGEDWTRNILTWSYQDGTLSVIRRGPFVKSNDDDPGYILSVYYGHWERTDPFIGTPEDQDFLRTDFDSTEVLKRHAEENQRLRWARLGWENLKDNLLLNQLSTPKELAQLQVHYRFLGAFVHPTGAESSNLVFGHHFPIDAPKYDHYASELALLYVCAIAIQELREFDQMTKQPPKVGLANWQTVEELLSQAGEQTSYFWFPGGKPHVYDRVNEANDRGVKDGKPVPRDQRPQPSQLADEEIRYYRNPLRRLIEMHSSWTELTGFFYTSSWPREDARFR